MTDLFISDLHLSPERPAVTRAFFDFLHTHGRKAERLYILGDLVEAWIGDDDPSTLSREIVAELRKLTDSGTALFFLHGNRDFLIGNRFARETGATILPEYHRLPGPEGGLLVCHGDTLCTDDADYQKFRRRVRNPVYRWLLAHLPLKTRQRIARRWRQKSRAANSNKAENILDVAPETVNSVMRKYRVDLLLHGHTHRPAVHHLPGGKRIVLGDWDSSGWYAVLEGDNLRLKSFPIGSSAEHNGVT